MLADVRKIFSQALCPETVPGWLNCLPVVGSIGAASIEPTIVYNSALY